jgi:hypothetical protein
MDARYWLRLTRLKQAEQNVSAKCNMMKLLKQLISLSQFSSCIPFPVMVQF